MSATANGQLDQSLLTQMPGEAGAYLLTPAAHSWGRIREEMWHEFQWVPRITSAGDAYRSYQRQVNVFLQRYAPRYATVRQRGRNIVDRRQWGGTYYWRHTGAAAAVPGTSNHGKGIAVDVTGLGWFGTARYDQFAKVATRHNWSNAEGASVSEPWHWVHLGATEVSNIHEIPVVNITVPGDDPLVPLNPTQEDEDIMAVRIRNERGQVFAVCLQTGLFTGITTPEFNLILGDRLAGPTIQVGQREFDVIRHNVQLAAERLTGKRTQITSDGSVEVIQH